MPGGVDGSMHFPLPSMDRLNQIESATFVILLFWAFFRGSIFLYFLTSLLFLCLKVGHEKLRKKLYIDEESDVFCQMVAE